MTPGATLIVESGSREAWNLDETVADLLAKECERVLRSGETRFSKDESGLGVLYATLKPLPRLLLLGAGLDAVPLVNMGADLGWRVTVVDHRPAYLERGGFERAERVIHVVPRLLAQTVPLADFDAIIVMSQHLTTDRTYLGQLADVDARYRRRSRAREHARSACWQRSMSAGQALRSRLKGPVASTSARTLRSDRALGARRVATHAVGGDG